MAGPPPPGPIPIRMDNPIAWSDADPAEPPIPYLAQRVALAADYPMRPPADQGFADDRAALIRDDQLFAGFHILGHCPVCRHNSSAVCATEYLSKPTESGDIVGEVEGFTGMVTRGDRQVPEAELLNMKQTTALMCACLGAHGAKDGGFGCGAEWLIEVFYAKDAATGKVLKRPVSLSESYAFWKVADANGAAIPSALTTAQASAAKWQTALTAFVGLVSIGSLLTGRATIPSLETLWKILLMVALAAAVGCNALVLWISDTASLGVPRYKQAPKLKDLKNADIAPLVEAQKTINKTRVAMGWTAATVVLALAAITMVLFAPTASPKAKYEVTTGTKDNGVTSVCGEITSQLPGDGSVPPTVEFKAPGKAATTLNNVVSIASC
jgi:hypothetical protein